MVQQRQRGVTLIELMTVIAIVGVLITTAVIYVRTSDYAATVKGFAHKIAAELDGARGRAVAHQKWQRVEVQANAVIHFEATTEGMGDPVAWNEIRRIETPNDIVVVAVDDAAHPDPGTDALAVGGLPATIDLAPDGSGDAATVFVGDVDDRNRSRVAMFGASGSVFVLEGW